jgi:hypothetical protein
MVRFCTVLLIITASFALLSGHARRAGLQTSEQYSSAAAQELTQQEGVRTTEHGGGWSFQVRKYKPRSTEPVRVTVGMPERHMVICCIEDRSTARRITSQIERSRRNVPARRLEHIYLTEEHKIGALASQILGIVTA